MVADTTRRWDKGVYVSHNEDKCDVTRRSYLFHGHGTSGCRGSGQRVSVGDHGSPQDRHV